MTIDSKGTEKEVQTDTDQKLIKDKNLHTRIQKEIRDNEKKTERTGISRKQEHTNLEKIADKRDDFERRNQLGYAFISMSVNKPVLNRHSIQ